MKKIFLYLFLFSLSFFSYSDESNPLFFLEKIIKESKPALINRNDDFLEKTMEKYIDFEEIALWVIGKQIWSTTEVDKKELFLIELKKLMLKTYSKTVYYYVDSDVIFLNPNPDVTFFDNKKRIQINSVMKKNNRNVSISYRLIKKNNVWLVYDVLIEGISILKSLKTQYADMVKNKGIDYTIDKIRNSNKS